MLIANSIRLLPLFLLIILASASITAAELSVEEIISKHLASIGTKEKRDEIKTQMATGMSEFASKLPPKRTTGKGAIVSEAGELLFITSFASNEYPLERIGYFKGSVNIPLGAFVADHSSLLSEGLFAGVISSSWNLCDPQVRRGTFETAGTKKIDGHKVYALNYFPKTNSSEFSVKMFFDAETFQHVRTEYRHAMSGKEATFGKLGNQSGVILTLTEEFGNFKTIDEITMPYSYKIKYMTDSNSGTAEWDWGFNVGQYVYNQKLKEDFFKF
jgi:hypothetical protein